METAVYLNNLNRYRGKNLSDYSLTFADGKQNGTYQAYQAIVPHVPDTFTHFYFGCEFCEYQLPEPAQLRAWLRLCDESQLDPVFVTSVVSDVGIWKIRECLRTLTAARTKIPVVVNDLGVLRMIRREFPEVPVIAGRILDKTSHDSRGGEDDFYSYYGEDGLRYAKTPGIQSGYSAAVLRAFEIDRFEFDLPKTGLSLPDHKDAYSLYWPYHYLTTGRVCLFRSFSRDPEHKFLVDGSGCPRQCTDMEVEYRKPLPGFYTEGEKRISSMHLLQKGNTIYYVLGDQELEENLPQFGRIIIQIL